MLFGYYACYSVESYNDSVDVPQSTYNKGVYAFNMSFGENLGKFPVVRGLYLRYDVVGIGFTFGNGESSYKPDFDYSIPHGNYNTISSTSGQFSIELSYYFTRLSKYYSTFVSLGGGVKTHTKIDVSNATGLSYINSKENITGVSYSVGIDIYPQQWLYMGLMWNNTNNVTFRFGYRISDQQLGY